TMVVKAQGAPCHTKFLRNRTVMPVILSANRMDGILYRATMGKQKDQAAATEEQERYLEYLKEGNEALCKQFTNLGTQSLDEEKQAKLDQELREAEIREKMVRLEDEQNRKERVMRANRILQDLKAGQLALHHAQMDSEIAYQRKYDAAVCREIAEDAKRQERLDEELCPEKLIPFCDLTEEELKAQEAAKAAVVKADFLKDIEERRQRRLEEKEQKILEGIAEREKYKCLKDAEDKAAKKLAERKRMLCRQAYFDALREKAEVAKYEEAREQTEDRVICVAATTRRNLDKRYNKELKAIFDKKIADRDACAVRIYKLQQAEKRKELENEEGVVSKFDLKVQADQKRRECRAEELVKQRLAYQLDERRQAEEKRNREAQIQRFEVATRMKNTEINQRFRTKQQMLKDKATSDLREVLHDQRDEFLERKYNELMRMSECLVDTTVSDDKKFFIDAVKAMAKARNDGRTVYPIAKAAEIYRRQNQIDMEPEGRSVHRNKLRDYCWPGYHSKADFAYRNYAHRDECREKQESDRHNIFANCIKITKMAAAERPEKKCDLISPIKCFQYRGIPAIESVDSFNVPRRHRCDKQPPAAPCPNKIQVMEN
ncbi:hypothetical protein KR222_000916, partial [Zaprionus bogoriensis]